MAPSPSRRPPLPCRSRPATCGCSSATAPRALLRLTDGAADLTVTNAGATSGTVSGTVALINVKDVTLSGTLSATFDSAATTQVVVSGTNVVLAVAGQQLSAARVTFSTSGSTVNLALEGGELSSADGGSGSPLVRATEINGNLTMVSGGAYGSISGGRRHGHPQRLPSPAPCWSALQHHQRAAVGHPGQLGVLERLRRQPGRRGQQIGGTFLISTQTIGGPDGNLATTANNEKVVTIVVADLTLQMGPTGSPFIHVRPSNHWSGALMITKSGIAATFSGTLTDILSLPGDVHLSGAVKFNINTGTAAVNRTFTVDVPATGAGGGTAQDAKSIALVLPGGPYLRFDITGGSLTAGAVSFSGSFSIEQRIRSGFIADTVLSANASETAVAVGDLNQDGFVDYVVGTGAAGYRVDLSVKGSTPGTNTWTTDAVSGLPAVTGTVKAIKIVDLNKDGLLDVVGARGRTSRGWSTRESRPLSTAPGLEQFAATSYSLTTANATSLAIGDVDQNGYQDLVVGRPATRSSSADSTDPRRPRCVAGAHAPPVSRGSASRDATTRPRSPTRRPRRWCSPTSTTTDCSTCSRRPTAAPGPPTSCSSTRPRTRLDRVAAPTTFHHVGDHGAAARRRRQGRLRRRGPVLDGAAPVLFRTRGSSAPPGPGSPRRSASASWHPRRARHSSSTSTGRDARPGARHHAARCSTTTAAARRGLAQDQHGRPARHDGQRRRRHRRGPGRRGHAPLLARDGRPDGDRLLRHHRERHQDGDSSATALGSVSGAMLLLPAAWQACSPGP